MSDLFMQPAIAFCSGIITSLIGSFLWARLTTPFSFGSSRDIDMRGQWKAISRIEGKIISEKIHVRRQFMGLVHGKIITPDPNKPDGVLECNFRGHLINSNTVRYWFWPRGKEFSDYGVGILEVDRSHKKGHGMAVLYGVFTNTLASTSFDIEYLEPGQ